MTTSDLRAIRTIRPMRHVHWYWTAAGNIALVAPGAGVGLVLAVHNGRTVPAAAVGAVLLLTIVIAVVPALRIRLELYRDGVRSYQKGGFAELRIARSQIRSAIFRTIYNGDGVTTNDHLFLLDAGGRTALRMSDRWWTREQLLAVAHHFDVSFETQAQPVQLAELRRTVPGQLRWAERHRFTGGGIVVVGGFLLCLAFAALVTTATR